MATKVNHPTSERKQVDGFIEIDGQKWPATFRTWRSRDTLIVKLHHPLLESIRKPEVIK